MSPSYINWPPPPPSHLIASALCLCSTFFTSHRLCPTSSPQAEPRVFVIQSSENLDCVEVSHSEIKPKFGCRQILEVQKDYHQEFLQLSQTSTCADYGASPVREPFFDMAFSAILI
ncbi:unnamed protein product [Prunus armeniaca]